MAAAGDRTRAFAAGAFRFAFESAEAVDRSRFESLFSDLPEPDPSEPLTGVYSVERVAESSPTEWMIDGPRLEEQPPLVLAAMLTRLMSAVNIAALDLEPLSLHLHAAAAARNGNAVVIAAEQNTGKTTTIAHLVDRGWSFITDETTRLSETDERVHGFAKPISIKPGGAEYVGHLRQHMIPPDQPGGESFHFVALGASGASISAEATPVLTVLLRRDEVVASSPTSRVVPAADAVVALMQNTLDAERHGRAAERLARLVAGAPCVEVTSGAPDETAALIERLASGASRATSASVSVLGPSPAIHSEVVSVMIDERVVVHHRGSGQIFALDEMGTSIWEQLGGWRDHGIDPEGPGVSSLVGQLASLGVLTGSRRRSRE